MENATKALLIAAAVLVAILIISLGIVIYNMAANTIGSVNLNEQEVQAHNEKFVRYEGSQRGTAVNAMLQQVLTANLNAEDDSRKVTVLYEKGKYIDENTAVSKANTLLAPGATSISTRVDSGASYNVITIRDATSQLVTKIIVNDKNVKDTSSGTTTE